MSDHGRLKDSHVEQPRFKVLHTAPGACYLPNDPVSISYTTRILDCTKLLSAQFNT